MWPLFRSQISHIKQNGLIKAFLLHQGKSKAEDRGWSKKVKLIYNYLMKDLNLKPEAVPPPAGEGVNADQGGSR